MTQTNSKDQHRVIPTERSDEGSLTSVRDDKRKDQELTNSKTHMSYIERIRQGVYRKVVKRINKKNRQAA